MTPSPSDGPGSENSENPQSPGPPEGPQSPAGPQSPGGPPGPPPGPQSPGGTPGQLPSPHQPGPQFGGPPPPPGGGFGPPGAMPPGPAFPGGQAPTPNAPGAVPALVLGILGILLCGLAAPFAWWQGKSAENAIASSGGRYRGKGMATTGKILGMVGVGLMILGIIAFIVLIVLGASGDITI